MPQKAAGTGTPDDQKELIRTAWDLLLPGAQDIAGYDTMDPKKVTRQMKKAETADLIKTVQIGQTFQVQPRIVITARGVDIGLQELGLPLRAHHCESHLAETLGRMRLSEPMNRILPRLFRSGAVQIPTTLALDPGDDPKELVIDESFNIVEIIFLPATRYVPLHAVAIYKNSKGELVWLPVVTIGLHHAAKRSARRLPKNLKDFCAHLPLQPGFLHRLIAGTPIGVLFVVIDQLAGLYVQRRYPGLPKAIIDADGNILEKLIPVPPVGRLEAMEPYSGRVGSPEEGITHLLRTPSISAMQGIPQRKTFEFVNSFPNASVGVIADGVGQPPSELRKKLKKEQADGVSDKYVGIIPAFEEAELMVLLDGRLMLPKDGRNAASDRDRQNANSIHSRLAVYTSDDPTYRQQQRHHDQDVARMDAQLKRLGIPSFPGWRLEVICPDGTQIRPDLWALIPIGNGQAMWHAVEIERSALAFSAIRTRLKNHRKARQQGEVWPGLWVLGKGVDSPQGRAKDDGATRQFMDIGGDLPILVIPRYRALDKDLSHLKSGWLRGEQTVPIDYLKRLEFRPSVIVHLDQQVKSGFERRGRTTKRRNGRGMGTGNPTG